MPSQPCPFPSCAKWKRLHKSALLCIALLGVLGLVAANARAQASSSSGSGVSRTAKAVTYRRGGVAKVSLQGTNLLPGSTGEAQVENKGNRVEIEVKFEGMAPATKFGFEFLTYALWAVSPQGRAVNLGEVQVKNGSAQVKAITDMQTFGMVVTAEPYFAVSQPGDEVVLENGGDAGGESIGATYELVPHGVYSSSNTKIENLIFGVDRKTPIELFQARNAVRIAKNANAEKYAAAAIAKADQQLQEAEDAYGHKRDSKTVISMSRDAVQTAEEARVISVKQKAEEDAQAQADADRRAAEERTAKARADAEEQANRRQEAEQARQQAEEAKAEAERMKEEAIKAAAEAAKAKEDADRARQSAVAEQQAALAQKQAAEAEAEKARQAAARAEAEKTDMRAQLLAQLNSILQTNDSARGLIVNMSDVLFDTGSFTLKPGAREKLAKVSGILLAHPGLTMQIEGHTDSVGSDAFNVRLSEQRANSVRDFLGEQGVSLSSITAQGFGKAEPVAANDTAEGRQRNRRVEIVVNGDSIGNSATAAARPANQNPSPDSTTNLPPEDVSHPEK
jgi:outer membrane protein OmpA-like peptidoglycan-associated protein